eukprot:4483000-Prymnesium_polylepis.1
MARKSSLPKLPVELFRPHSGRYGAVLNLKRAKVPASIGAAHCCMSMHFWDTVYRWAGGLLSPPYTTLAR